MEHYNSVTRLSNRNTLLLAALSFNQRCYKPALKGRTAVHIRSIGFSLTIKLVSDCNIYTVVCSMRENKKSRDFRCFYLSLFVKISVKESMGDTYFFRASRKIEIARSALTIIVNIFFTHPLQYNTKNQRSSFRFAMLIRERLQCIILCPPS